MPDISKLTKAQLINIIQQQEENKFDELKIALGLPYQTDEEWIEFIKDIISSNQRLINKEAHSLY